MISSTGRSPRNAMPFAIPSSAASLIGVVSTRLGKITLQTTGNLERAAIRIQQVLSEHDHFWQLFKEVSEYPS